MTKSQLIAFLAFGGMATVISCDNGAGGTATGLESNDCPIGTFRPAGLADCVFPATDINGQSIGVSDNRCAFGLPSLPPSCVSSTGERAYLSVSQKCAPGYRFFPGACNRNGGFAGVSGFAGTVGTAGFFGDAGTGGGFAGAAGQPDFGAAGFAGDSLGVAGGTGQAGVDGTGTAGSTVSGAAGASGTGGTSDAGPGDASGAGGTG